MRAGDYREALGRLPFGKVGDLVGRDPFLVLSPHPDDETLGCGGLLAAAEAAGARGHVLILTDGAASHPNSPSHPAERLTALRRDETRRALGHLGLPEGRLGFLDLRDAATPGDGPEFDAAVDAIVRRAEVGARALFVTWGHDPHCDHETAYAMARSAAARLSSLSRIDPRESAQPSHQGRQDVVGEPTTSCSGVRLWAYPVWGLHLPPETEVDEPSPRGWRLDIAVWRAAKRRAIDCYASQMTRLIDDDPSAFCFTEEQLLPFLGDVETFIAVTP